MDDLQDLLEGYQNTATMLYQKRMELRRKLPHLWGEAKFEAEKRLDQLDDMYLNTCDAIKLMVKSRKGMKP